MALSDFERQEMDAQQRLGQDAVRSLGPVAADEDFRRRLRAQFVRGEIAAGAPLEAPARPQAPVVSLPVRRTTGPLVSFAIAAALALMVVALNTRPGPRLVSVQGSGVVEIDGQVLTGEDLGRMASVLRPGSRITTLGDVAVDLIYPGSLGLRVEPGSSAVLPEAPGRWFGRRIRSDLQEGELAIRTGPDLQGGAYLVTTPQGDTTITGTLVSVFTNTDLTCVCLIEGHASVAVGARDLGPIPDGKRWVVFADDREPQMLGIEAVHETHLLDFDADLGFSLTEK